MHLASPFACIAFSCVVQSLAISHVARNEHQYSLGMTTYSGGNFCSKASFYHETSSDSPLEADCQKILDHFNEERDMGDEYIGWDKDHLVTDYMDIYEQGTCVLAVKPVDAYESPAVITHGDYADLFQGAIDKLGGDKLRSSGQITCQVPDNAHNRHALTLTGPWGTRKFEWQIFKPGDVPIL
ncbi:hypothetical protein FHL15_010142 [Xylaria flabelliformis]|uniref:Ecp2 effector protein-like domain-containing protein n=1 Tax=Xylaria flabelliformis TaxID=2512241 RepID=A0A553HLS8_9PEZI|nr:hypothetical protein FHL15_010142 [Xylaria flabelliformis]